jgi:hypothetical protein
MLRIRELGTLIFGLSFFVNLVFFFFFKDK